MSDKEWRSFSRDFKLKAVERLEAGESGSALARELDVKWVLILKSKLSPIFHRYFHRYFGYFGLLAKGAASGMLR